MTGPRTDRFSPIPALAPALAAMCLASCASVTHVETTATPDPAIRPTTDAVFAYPVEPIPVEDRLVSTKGRYELHRISFPSIAENGQTGNLVTGQLFVDLDYFPNGTPPSSENIARYVADKLARRITLPGIRVSRVTAWESEDASATYFPA